MFSNEEFQQWALHPARTNDELFTLELLLESTDGRWQAIHKQYAARDWDAQQRHKHERSHNPAYRPQIRQDQLDKACEVRETINYFSAWGDDRQIRDLQALRFFPNLTNISLTEVEAGDLSPLLDFPKLRTLSLHEPSLRHSLGTGDLSTLGKLTELETLSLQLQQVWPDLRWLADLTSLRSLSFRVNLLALAGVGPLPGLCSASFHHGFHWQLPLRDLHCLPEMPLLEKLAVNPTDSLEGIGRYPALLNLEIEGTFRDLEPLETLQKATFLKLTSDYFEHLAPLTRMPKLRELLMVREEPLFLEVLTDSASLREVRMERCGILATELAALNAALSPVPEDFLLLEPRALPPVRFITYHPQHEEMAEYYRLFPNRSEIPAELQADPALQAAFARWLYGEIDRRLDALLGRGWRKSTCSGYPQIRRQQDVIRFREIIGELWDLMACSRYPFSLMLCFQPHGDLAENMDDLVARQPEEQNPDRDHLDFDYDEKADHEEFRQGRREEYARRAAAHLLKLKQEQGLPIDPAEFSTLPPAPPKARAVAGDIAGDIAEDDTDEEEDGGGTAQLPPDEDQPSELAEDLEFIVTLNQDALWATAHMLENAEYNWGEAAENWHAMGPFADRPQPR